MIMKRKGFDAAQNSQMDLRINRLKRKKKSERINVASVACHQPKQECKEIGPNWLWVSLVYQQ